MKYIYWIILFLLLSACEVKYDVNSLKGKKNDTVIIKNESTGRLDTLVIEKTIIDSMFIVDKTNYYRLEYRQELLIIENEALKTALFGNSCGRTKFYNEYVYPLQLSNKTKLDSLQKLTNE